jgi:predicted nucleotidyltransferase
MNLSPEERIKIKEICADHHLRIMVLFGSSVEGKGRDLDIAAFLSRGTAAAAINKLELIAALESIFNKKVDLVVVNPSTSTTLLYEISKKNVLLHEDREGSFQEEQSLAFRKYADTVKFRQLREKNIQNFIEGESIVP